MQIDNKIRKRFWAKVYKHDGGCWFWTGATDKDGYGDFQVEDKRVKAHRFSYLLHFGDLEDLQVLHTCDEPSCVNPDHLFLGSQADNIHDCMIKGRRYLRSKVLSAKQVKEIRQLHATNLHSQRSLAKDFGVTHKTIADVIYHKRAYQ